MLLAVSLKHLLHMFRSYLWMSPSYEPHTTHTSGFASDFLFFLFNFNTEFFFDELY